ncbi:MAG: hypothetical protein V4662_25585 [Verrucomicrobiota bacterium]
MDAPPSSASWPETQWDRILALRDPVEREAALREICEKYHVVILAQCRRWNEQDGEDMAQSFLLWVIEERRLELADPARGRFRFFLRTMLKNYQRKAYRSDQAQKRGGGVEHVDWVEEASWTPVAPDETFDRDWALDVMKRIISALQAEAAGSGIKDEVLSVLLPSLRAEEDAMEATWEAHAMRLGVAAGTLRSQASRLRNRFRELMEREVSAFTCGSDLEAEIRYLMSCLGTI